MHLPLYQVDAFADTLFAGNPAAVCLLTDWLPDAMLQAVALENNLSETAYLVPDRSAQAAGDPAAWELRWFTPAAEVPLCGHATLASAHVLFEALGLAADRIRFRTRRSGILTVARSAEGLEMDFPAMSCREQPVEPPITAALGSTPDALYAGENDWMAVFATRRQVAGLAPDMGAVAALPTRAVIATAPADPALDGDADFVSRMFAPALGISEDPVTGAAHCLLTPYWAARLGRTGLRARQISARGGRLVCTLDGERVRLAGRAVLYLTGTIRV